MKNKRGNVVVIVIIIVIVAITSGIIGWMFAKKSQAPVQQSVVNQPVPVAKTQPITEPIAPTDETTNWQTYSNTKYGFEFKYPQFYNAGETFKDIKDKEGLVLLNDKSLKYGSVNVWVENTKLDPDNILDVYGKIERKNLKTVTVGSV